MQNNSELATVLEEDNFARYIEATFFSSWTNAMSNRVTAKNGSARFPTTAWGCIQAAQDPDHKEHVPMMNWLITTYWKPVFYFIRAKGQSLQAAEDLTQAFFLRFLEKDWLRPADPKRGRFRNFLLKIVQRFLADQGPNRGPRQPSFERQFVLIATLMGEEERSFEPPTNLTPETIYMKKWATDLIQRVQSELRGILAGEGRELWYDIFAAVHDVAPSQNRPTQETLAKGFGLTRDKVRYYLEQAEKRFERLLRAEVRGQVGSEDEINEEIRDVRKLLQA